MNDFDQSARYAARANPDAVVQRVVRPARLPLAFREWLDTRTVPLPGGADRTADLVAALDDGRRTPVALIFEFQSQHDADKLEVTLEEVAAMRRNLRRGKQGRGKYRVIPVLIYLTGRCPEDVLDMTVGGYGTIHKPLVWNVCDDEAGETLEAVASGTVSWGMLFWVSLMRGANHPTVVARWREVVTQVVANEETRATLSLVARTLSDLPGRRVVWERGLEGLTMTELPLWKEIRTGGRIEGELRTRQDDLLELLRIRLPDPVPPEIVQLVKEQDSLEMLKHWFRAAAKADTLEQFQAVLKG